MDAALKYAKSGQHEVVRVMRFWDTGLINIKEIHDVAPKKNSRAEENLRRTATNAALPTGFEDRGFLGLTQLPVLSNDR